MNWLHTLLIVVAAFVAVFLEATLDLFGRWLSARIDLLPALMVYTGLSCGLATITVVSVCAGLGFDSLSANPPGITVLPLFLVGFLIHQNGHLLLRTQVFARLVLGAGASVAVPVLALVLLFTFPPQGLHGARFPLVGWGTLWQLLVMAGAGAVATPAFFSLFGLINRAISYQPTTGATFRADREIKRGRS